MTALASGKLKGSKITSLNDFQKLRASFKRENIKVVHCHGVFDLLHPGHIAHLEEAKSLGDVLVISVTSAPFVNKGPGRPHFSDELRMQSLAALSSVDYVLLSESPTALEILEIIQPDIYVKGREYEKPDNDVTNNIDREIAKVQSLGGNIYFTDGVVFSSTRLLNNNFSVFPPRVKEFAREFASRYSFEDIRQIIDEMKNVRTLVIGDIIIDEYVLCRVQGLMSKDRAFSARYLREERYLGGSLAIARHISNFTNNVNVCGIVGVDPTVHSQILNDLSRTMFLDLQFDTNFRTVTKRRYIEQRGIRNEYEKLFSINYLDDTIKNNIVDLKAFYAKLEDIVPKHDLVVLADYGHGLIDETAMEIIQSKAKFLALNCQTNSSNYGTNLITKYNRADAFSLDEAELRLAFTSRFEDANVLLGKLIRHLKGDVGWLTQGSLGAVSINENLITTKTPALTLTVQDTVGAGDAFFALASLCAQANHKPEIGSFLGNIAGALAANVLGNSQAVSKPDLLKFASTLLKF